MGLHVWSALQVSVAVPLACWPLGQVTGTVWPTTKPPCEALVLLSDHPGGRGQDLAMEEDREDINGHEDGQMTA
ncbi:hypothetical protein AALO_G00297200 [Alosa alosa]|uniref:Uncharacterized protein n=1 Tax=Alosa alosa TaxID=278164 RepID=A0AAV6FHG1_9TELE|nr:hypothetical protein AALO_G00297200 [Alosa alosa]